MYGQVKLIEGIRSFSPTRDKWVAKPVEELPGRVTVTFKAGQRGILDMKNPRAVHWADMFDRYAQANQPLYVEIDEESNVIINVLVPEVCKVERLGTDEFGNLMVRLQSSAVVHFLLQSDSNFESMRDSLQAALDDGSERLITETRDEHEIIDVRLPVGNPGNPSDPAPPAPPDPPVSEARALDLFNQMSSETCAPCSPTSNCIPFMYPDDGCWVRAHIMCHLMRTGGPDTTVNPPEDPEKVWIHANTILNVPTPNHPDCHVQLFWDVAPTLMVILPGGNEKRVLDPSLSPSLESLTDWRDMHGDPGALLTETSWLDYNWVGDMTSVSLAQAYDNMQIYRDQLRDRCLTYGPPPYNCTKNCFFIIDRNTFSNYEVEAMLNIASPARIEAAFYVVVDGFSPQELGFTSATMQHTPTLSVSPAVSGMTITADRLEFEYPAHLNRRQRLTWVYNIDFTNTSGFTAERRTVTLQASVSSASGSVSSTGYLYLIQQPNPYEIDGPTSWLSTDLRVFQARQGESRFNVTMGSDPSAFITQVVANLNSGSTGGQTFENNISVDQQTSHLELSQLVNGIPVYNFAVAKVRYRAETVSATNVRVFFRLFPWETTSVSYNQATEYRRYESGGMIIPLLGIRGSQLSSIPCFASPRVNSATVSLTAQTDAPNVQTIPPNPSGAEVVRYYGCWLDINQTQPQFPITPSPVNGPFTSGRLSIQEHVRGEHQCLVAEIAFTPAPVQNGSTPSTSDKLAQRNLAIVESANPGLAFSRRIPQTFEIQPSTGKLEHDELMIDWGNVPAGSVATLYLPGIDTSDIMLLAAQKYRSHRLVRIDEHTLKLGTGGITYLPIPFTEGSYPGMLTVGLPEGVVADQAFTIVVRQVTGEALRIVKTHRTEDDVIQPGLRHIVGSFQLTIPVRDKANILPRQQRLLSNLRWIERAIPANDRWAPVFSKYVTQIAHRVDALGGNSNVVAPSASGQWQAAYTLCLLLALVTVLLIALLVVGIGALAGNWLPMAIVVALILLTGTVSLWRRRCRPTRCQLLLALLAGTGVGTLALGILALVGISTPQLIATLIAGAGVTVLTALVCWLRGCFRR